MCLSVRFNESILYAGIRSSTRELIVIGLFLAVCVAFIAMIIGRSLARPLVELSKLTQGILEMREHSGTQIDSEIVEALIEHLDKIR